MKNKKFISPYPSSNSVLFLVFNRFHETKEVFREICKAKPPRLYIASDGPREWVNGEKEKVLKIREMVTTIDWQCEIKTLFRDKNLGCKEAVSEAISWFFKNEHQGIILEDDCRPSQSFFWFCDDLLEKYKNDQSISQITGRFENINLPKSFKEFDYFISNRGFIWGWATWRRVAINFDVDWIDKEKIISLIIKVWNKSNSLVEFMYRTLIIIQIKYKTNKSINSWAYPWNIKQNLLDKKCIIPTKNLIKNIGFGKNATHTKIKNDNISNEEINFPIRHSNNLYVNYTKFSILEGQTSFRFLISSFKLFVLILINLILKKLKLK